MPSSLGPAEIMVILIVALIVLGPKKLPEAGRQVGKALAEVRKWSTSFQDEIRSVVEPETRPTYSQPQPGYEPPLPVLPAETALPEEAGATTTTGSSGEVPGSTPVDTGPADPPAERPHP